MNVFLFSISQFEINCTSVDPHYRIFPALRFAELEDDHVPPFVRLADDFGGSSLILICKTVGKKTYFQFQVSHDIGHLKTILTCQAEQVLVDLIVSVEVVDVEVDQSVVALSAGPVLGSPSLDGFLLSFKFFARDGMDPATCTGR